MLSQFGEYIQAETLSNLHEVLPDVDLQQTVSTAGGDVTFAIKKII